MKFRDPTKSMLANALEMLNQADRLQRQFFQLGKTRTRRPSWEPPVDIFDTGDELSILAALPGVSPNDVQVIIDGGTLYIVGERQIPGSPGALRRLEIPYGLFERRIDLPAGHYEIGERKLENGCLLLTLKKLADR